MFRFAACLVFLLALTPSLAFAGQAEVRDVAVNNNCPPKKIDVYKSSLGGSGETVYRVTCTLPKAVGEDKGGAAADALMISCVQNLCNLLHPTQAEKK